LADRTPDQWRDELVGRLEQRWQRLRVYDAYYEGDQLLAFVTRKFRAAYGQLFKELADNYMPLVIDAAAERLRVQGFRFGDSIEADRDAWSIWQANKLDAAANMVHTEAIKLEEAYWLVQPNGKVPRITAEHPSQVIVACAPGDRTTRLAGLKRWADGEEIYANVYLPDRVVKYRTTPRSLRLEEAARRWETIGAIANPLGVVPLIPVANNPSMLRGGRSDLAAGVLRIQDAINKLLCDMLIGSEYQAYPQRVLLGVDVPRDENGDPIKNADLKAAQSHLWYFPSENAKAFEFSAADLENFRKAMDGMIGDLAAQTRIPVYYFRPTSISNISAETLIGLDAGLVSKTDDKKDPFGEAHEEMMRLAFLAADRSDPRAAETSAETIWRNTEYRSDAQIVDAATKKSTIGVPWEQLMEDLGYSPQQIERMDAMRQADSILSEAQQPAAPAQSGSATPAASEPAAPGVSTG
jgi:hypothetical protein